MMKNSYSFLVIGNTQKSTEGTSFKRYVGVGSSFVLDVNPNKKKTEELLGYELANDPEYVVDTDNGKEARITFIVRTDPSTNNDINITNRLLFTLRNNPAYNRDHTKVQVIDDYGNTSWGNIEDVKAGKKLISPNGKELMLDTKYRMAFDGEASLVTFLKTYLGIKQAFKYVNETWVKNDDADTCKFKLENIKDYFKGNVTEIKEAIALQPNNKVKLCYSVRTTDEGKQYQTILTHSDFILPNYAGSKAYEKVERAFNNAKDRGSYATTEFKVQPLTEYVVTPTNLDNVAATNNTEDVFGDSSDSELPWDA